MAVAGSLSSLAGFDPPGAGTGAKVGISEKCIWGAFTPVISPGLVIMTRQSRPKGETSVSKFKKYLGNACVVALCLFAGVSLASCGGGSSGSSSFSVGVKGF